MATRAEVAAERAAKKAEKAAAKAVDGGNDQAGDMPMKQVEQHKPEGEIRVERRTSKKDPEFKEFEIEKLPTDWGIPDRVQTLLEAKMPDGSPMGAEVIGDRQAQKVRVRIPMKNYLANIRAAEEKSESRRRAKTPGATIDKTKRTSLDLAALTEGRDEAAAKSEAVMPGDAES